MSAAAGRVAAKVGSAASKAAETASKSNGKDDILKRAAKRDPELYILAAVMTGAFGLAGFYFGRKPTSASSEASVSMAEGSMPWQAESSKGNKDFKYQYHPGGDRNKAPKDAPSALHTTIIPNVTLTKAEHDRFNKWGKPGY